MRNGLSNLSTDHLSFFRPEWQGPEGVTSFCTTRRGGAGISPYESMNLGAHVGDRAETVQENRIRLQHLLGMPEPPYWLTQVHGSRVVEVGEKALSVNPEADAAYSRTPGKVLAVMTADCLPILLASEDGKEIAAVHAGWRGLAEHIINAACQWFSGASPLVAWIGPSIGPCHYEVGEEVKAHFTDAQKHFFLPGKDKKHHWMDMQGLARSQLREARVHSVLGGDICTHCDRENFFSYRRDGVTGRFATLIWIDPKR